MTAKACSSRSNSLDKQSDIRNFQRNWKSGSRETGRSSIPRVCEVASEACGVD
uniref:Uncharacterized protein n=1 Tax=Rhizophora mucronata TaxID=61149 RepID=A0A2P2NX95_RHIMU